MVKKYIKGVIRSPREYIVVFLGAILMTAPRGFSQTPSFRWAEKICPVQGYQFSFGRIQTPLLATDPTGHIYAAGLFSGQTVFGDTILTSTTSENYRNIFLAKYDDLGGVVWVTHVLPYGADHSTEDILGDIAVDKDGNCYVSGYTFSGYTSDSPTGGFLAKYNSAGTLLWATNVCYSSYDGPDEIVRGVAVDSSGNIYVTGSFYARYGANFSGTIIPDGFSNHRSYLVKYNESGERLWLRMSSIDGDAYAYGVAVDSSGNPIITGAVSGSNTLFEGVSLQSRDSTSDVMVVKYDSDGNVFWAKSGGGSGTDRGRSVASDTAGHISIMGQIGGDAVFEDTTVLGVGYSDLLIAQYDSDGALLWVTNAGSDRKNTYGDDVTMDTMGNTYVTGYFNSPLVLFGDHSLSSAGRDDGFLAKYDSQGDASWAKSIGGSGYDFLGGCAMDGQGHLYTAGICGFYGNDAVIDGITLTGAVMFVAQLYGATEATSPVVSNVRASQRSGTKLVDIWYDVSDSDGDLVDVSIGIESGIYAVSATGLTGDIGTNLVCGTNKKVTWDAGADWPGNFSILTITVTADEGSASTSLSVDTRDDVLSVSIDSPSPGLNWFVGNSITFEAVVSNANGTLSYAWDLDGDGTNDNAFTQTASASYSSDETRKVSVEISDDDKTASASLWVATGKACLPNEPAVNPVPDPDGGKCLNIDGETPIDFYESQKANGFVMIVHGMRSSSAAGWVREMGSGIQDQLALDGPPNICLYDWEDWANPSKLNNDIVLDILQIKPAGRIHGERVAEWIDQQIKAGNIDPAAPIHLIGHSAGGFVVGEAGYLLTTRQFPEYFPPEFDVYYHDDIESLQVTMLDTPYPVLRDINDYPDPGCLEQIVSSWYGTLEALEVSETDHYKRLYRSRFGDTLFDIKANRATHFSDDHGYACQWYIDTIKNGDHEGFYYSPVLDNGFYPVDAQSAPLAMVAQAAEEPFSVQTSTNISLTGFSSFGNVAAVSNEYTITELANAGLYKTIEFPEHVRTLQFDYQFTGTGDGDFLSVHVGSNQCVCIGIDTALSRSNFVATTGWIREFAGTTDQLTFKLVSRGESNAVLVIKNIELVCSLDSDGDGISDDDESNSGFYISEYDTGTDPSSPDSDGDKTDDGDEMVAGTDPTSSSSYFHVTTDTASTGTPSEHIVINWESVADRVYNVLWTPSLAEEPFQPLETGIQYPQNSYTDTVHTVESSGFYRVVVMRANYDADGDGLPNDWEEQYAATDARVDADSDGFDNLAEFIAGTDPTNKASFFAAANSTADINGTNCFIVEWISVPDRQYRVLWSTNLVSGFQTLETGIEHPQNSYTDTVHSAESQGYYKVDVQMKP